MSTRFISLATGLLSGLTLGQVAAFAELEVSTSVRITAEADFHAPLSPHGAWIQVGPYGRCWRPAGVAVAWRPYCHGHWLWTDCGWYWASDEPWAWACYHYGWWVHDSSHGWVWVPGLEWAPAWVSWRVGGGYCGWAPLPPRHATVSVHSFVFVEARRFQEPVRPSTVFVNQAAIIKNSSPVPGLKREPRNFDDARAQVVMVNDGPGRDLIETATRKEIGAVPIRDAARQTPLPPELLRKDRDNVGKEKPAAPKAQNQTPGSPPKPPKPAPPGKDIKPPRSDAPPPPPRSSPPPPAKRRPQPNPKGNDDPGISKGKGPPHSRVHRLPLVPFMPPTPTPAWLRHASSIYLSAHRQLLRALRIPTR